MKRFFLRIFRFFWSWGFLKFMLGLIALVVLFYVEEDWRGASMWAATKAKWEAQGESFDYKKFIPPPVPDEQNLAALPVFELTKDADGWLEAARLKEALDDTNRGGDLGPMKDKSRIAAAVAKAYAKTFKGANPSSDPLVQLETLYPILPDVRAVADSRQQFRFNGYYDGQLWNRRFGPITDQIKLSKLLMRHALIALGEKKPGVALEDVKASFTLARGVGQDPTLVGGLVSVGIVASTRGAIVDGIENHYWNDTQLADLQTELARLDILALYQFSLRGEVVTGTVPVRDMTKRSASLTKDIPRVVTNLSPENDYALFADTWPTSWWDIDTAKSVDFIFREVRVVDANAKRMDPAASQRLKDESDALQQLPESLIPWNLLYRIGVLSLTNMAVKFARVQVCLDQDRIACGLERYRLAKGVYPQALEELAPAYLDAVPHDIMNGGPYHYRLNPDGTFLLYSVGWDQADDGGTVVFETDSPGVPSYEHGDWVWPAVR